MASFFRSIFGKSGSSGGSRKGPAKFDKTACHRQIKEGINKEVQDYLASKSLRGGLGGQQKQISATAQKMLDTLAERKLQKEMKNQEKKEAAEGKKVKAAEDKKKQQSTATKAQEAHPPAKSYFFGYTEEV